LVIALTRPVPRSIDRCELTHLERTPIDYAKAVREHDAYEESLRRLGCRVQRLPEAHEMPDSVFVEDTAVVFDEIAVIARPGAVSRRGEVEAAAHALRPHRQLAFIEPPATLDGGDVLVTPGKVFVGITERTNADGARQLAAHLAPFGFETIAVPVTGCLHLKSAVTLARVRVLRSADLPAKAGSHYRAHPWLPPSGGRSKLVINPAWVQAGLFHDFDLIEIDRSEPMAANVLLVGDRVVCAEEHPRTRQRLEAHGIVTVTVPAAELARAEGGVTCCSLLVRNT
jgi:dimethylargininase